MAPLSGGEAGQSAVVASQCVAFQAGEATRRAEGERSQAVNTRHVGRGGRGNGSARSHCGGSHAHPGVTHSDACRKAFPFICVASMAADNHRVPYCFFGFIDTQVWWGMNDVDVIYSQGKWQVLILIELHSSHCLIAKYSEILGKQSDTGRCPHRQGNREWFLCCYC